MATYTRKFSDTRLTDVPVVGGKNASLGEMFSQLTKAGVRVPDGYATTAGAYRYFLQANRLDETLAALMGRLDRTDYANLSETGRAARALILKAVLPSDLATEILAGYRELGGGTPIAVAVRSSATAEDLPGASFAGQHESYLNIRGESAVLEAVKNCYASLYTDRAIKYREDNGFAHAEVALSVGIQKMVRADKAGAGVGFTLEPESGFRDVIHLAGVWGLGENIVQGASTPDEYLVFKPSLRAGKRAIIRKTCGEKERMLVYADEAAGQQGEAGVGGQTMNLYTPAGQREQWVLSDDEITQLARWALTIEEHYARPMDFEWAKDGETGEIFIVQARPETVQSRRNLFVIKEYTVTQKGECLVKGEAVGERITTGIARILSSPEQEDQVKPGEIIITDITSPDWDPVLKKAGAIITNKGGRTSHASIVARELGVPAIVGSGDATAKIKDGEEITVSCCEGQNGFVYRGKATWQEREVNLGKLRMPKRVKPMLIVGDPDRAFELSFHPSAGVGLMRMEFIVTHFVQAHPMALVNYGSLKDSQAKREIAQLSCRYPDKKKYFVDQLASGIAMIAAAFHPRPVILRTSDFKTNEYANLLGGLEFEPQEENPMLGFRGASRYYHPLYKEGFRLECEAIRVVREEMGLRNVIVMIPFCRTVEEGRKVLRVMAESGLRQHENGLEVYVMAEIPSNVLLAAEFASVFDGFSIGSNDLTQLTLGIDRDSSIVAELFSEQDAAAKRMIGNMIAAAKAAGARIGLCGQAPSDFPEFAQFLVDRGIDSISFNADALLKGIENIVKAEDGTVESKTTEHIL
ncbi:MAG TPA: phosphoenolpyruvate synthase [Puia sp.]|nr:phosphoenolpyruvate synthase [Puia sp.]